MLPSSLLDKFTLEQEEEREWGVLFLWGCFALVSAPMQDRPCEVPRGMRHVLQAEASRHSILAQSVQCPGRKTLHSAWCTLRMAALSILEKTQERSRRPAAEHRGLRALE